MGLLEIDEIQARAILDMQLRKLAALERQELINERDDLEAKIADYESILSSPERQREIVGTELAEIVTKYGDDRRTEIIAYDGEVADEDLIAEEDVAVTITYGGYAKRTKTDLYRAQRRGGKGVRGAQLRTDDIVDHFFITTTHHWILFFTNKGRVYRAKAYELPDAGRDARGQHVANLLAFQPDERIAEVLALRDYQVAPYLVLATRSGLVKKSKLTAFENVRSGGIIAINLREDDEVIAARLVSPEDDLLLVSKGAQAIRFHADDDSLRPMGRDTSGVKTAPGGLLGQEIVELVAVLVEQRLGAGQLIGHGQDLAVHGLETFADISVGHEIRSLDDGACTRREVAIEAAIERRRGDHRDKHGGNRGDDRERLTICTCKRDPAWPRRRAWITTQTSSPMMARSRMPVTALTASSVTTTLWTGSIGVIPASTRKGGGAPSSATPTAIAPNSRDAIGIGAAAAGSTGATCSTVVMKCFAGN